MSTMMALKNAASNYLVIESYDLNTGTVKVAFYQDKNHKNNGDTQFLKASRDTYSIPYLIDYADIIPSVDGSLDDNIKAICYNELLGLPEFMDWVQEIKPEKVAVVNSVRVKVSEKKAARKNP